LSEDSIDDSLAARSAVSPEYAALFTDRLAGNAEDPNAVLFDAILIKKSERLPILRSAHAAGVPVIAVWLRTPLDVCVARNAARSINELCDEEGLRNVFAALEPRRWRRDSRRFRKF
jgi:predicted kinase